MSLQRALDRAIRDENASPKGLPADMLAAMETAIRANPEKYPILSDLIAGTKPCDSANPSGRIET